jgi:hypothetical protein
MSSKAPPCSTSSPQFAVVPDSVAQADDLDDGHIARILTIVIGLYLLVSIVLLRAAYRLRRSKLLQNSPS